MPNEIVCPACGYKFSTEDQAAHVTYWGEDGPKEDMCPRCDAGITITENVERVYSVTLSSQSIERE